MTEEHEKGGRERQYKMTVAGQLFKHLGLQMYSGAVPVITELISNSYDAMARNVWIEIPTEHPIKPSDKIIVRDDGHGMTFDECNNCYLSVGRDRRRATGKNLTEPYNGLQPRKAQGRKGIGKLAGFGIANILEVETVKNNMLSHFLIDFNRLTQGEEFADTDGYSPDTLPEDGASTEEKSGTVVTLHDLKIKRRISEDQIMKSIARRLLVLDESFAVYVNSRKITRGEIPFQFRFPKEPGKWETEYLGNEKQINWWVGFCKDPIPEEEQRGLIVYVRGKLAQTPWFFDLSGGVWGQHGMQYLTGEIKADFLDEESDLIATDRGSIRWDDPIAEPLKEWGRNKIKELLEEWATQRSEKKLKTPTVTKYMEQAKNLPKRDRDIFKKMVKRICSTPQLDKDKDSKDIADEIVKLAYNAITNRSLLETIRQLNASSPADRDKMSEVLKEWGIIEAVNIACVIKGRMQIITKFQQMIQARFPEKPDMQNHLRDHSWLIDPQWMLFAHEKTLDNLISEYYGLDRTETEGGTRRPDFFCLGDKHKTAYVVEVKRPGYSIGKKELDQLRDYVYIMREKLQKSAMDEKHRREIVKGLLIADKIQPEWHQLAEGYRDWLSVRTWDNLLLTAKMLYEDFFKTIRERAEPEDPRIKDLANVDAGPPSTPSAEKQK